MPNSRDIKLDDYNISKFAYRELKYFCLQYPEKKRKIADLHNPLKGVAYDGMPHGTNPGEPTANAAEQAAQLSNDCELIEQTAIEAAPEIYQGLLKAVTEGWSYYELREICGMKCSKGDFNKQRRAFFFLLFRKKVYTEIK